MIPGWGYNEARTLQMELELFDKFKRDFGVSGATIANADHPDAGDPVTAQMLAGERNAQMAPIGTPSDEGYVPASGDSMKNVLQRFNAFNDKTDENLIRDKVAILNTWLTDRGFATIPVYNDAAEARAKENRDRFLKDFRSEDLPGVLLPFELDPDDLVGGP